MKKNNQIHMHIDADAFFASVEQVLHRELVGKAIVVGQNGGIVSALSYPAKGMGIPRVMPITQVRKKYPNVSVVASDYFAYKIFSERLERIIRSHIPNLVKNSVDECSADLSLRCDNLDQAEELAFLLQKELSEKLGCTFSFGIATSPLLAKLSSGLNKPEGVTVIKPENMATVIYPLPVNYLSGIGKKTTEKLQKYNIHTIHDLIKADPDFLRFNFSIAIPIIQKQANGETTSAPKQKEGVKSMSRDRTFIPNESIEYLHSQASLNIEHLAKRMREENLFTKRIGLRLRDQNLNHSEIFLTLPMETRDADYILSEVHKLLKKLYQVDVTYRQVSVICANLTSKVIQGDLFHQEKISEKKDFLLQKIDILEKKFGKLCIQRASSLSARDHLEEIYSKHIPGDTYPHPLVPGEEEKRRLAYPFLGLIC